MFLMLDKLNIFIYWNIFTNFNINRAPLYHKKIIKGIYRGIGPSLSWLLTSIVILNKNILKNVEYGWCSKVQGHETSFSGCLKEPNKATLSNSWKVERLYCYLKNVKCFWTVESPKWSFELGTSRRAGFSLHSTV